MNILSDKLTVISDSLYFIGTEIVLAALILILIIADLIFKESGYRLIQIGAIIGVLLLITLDVQQLTILKQRPVPLFLGMLHVNQGVAFWKLLIDAGALIVLLINTKRQSSNYRVEVIQMLFFMLLAAHILIMSSNLLMVYLSIEMLSIGAYILTASSYKQQGYEAGIKYLLFGGVASAIMLYGMSFIYALTGSLNFLEANFPELLLAADTLPLLLAGVLVIAGLLFKVTLAPMHIWAPDVYQSAPTPIVAFFSIVPKIAGFAILIKWMIVLNLFGLGVMPWTKILGGVALLSLLIGNFSALLQNNVKRMLAYSSIAHSGFLLIGLVAFSEAGLQSLVFYVAVYVIMNGAVFLLVNFFEEKHGFFNVDQYKGLAATYPFLTVLMVVVMIALTGLPPTAGFTAKLFVFSSLWESYNTAGDRWVLLIFVFGLLNAVVSLFYYLKLPYYMVFKQTDLKIEYKAGALENYFCTFLVVVLLILFFQPGWLMNVINNVNFAF